MKREVILFAGILTFLLIASLVSAQNNNETECVEKVQDSIKGIQCCIGNNCSANPELLCSAPSSPTFKGCDENCTPIWKCEISNQTSLNGETDEAEQELDEEDIKVPSQRGYGWYKFKEKWKNFWVWNAEAKFRFKTKLAAKRAAELKFMIENNITKNLDIVTKLYNKTLEDIERKLEQWQEKGKNTTLIEEKIENLTYKHYLVLQRVYERAPLAARAGLMNAILTAKEHNLRMQIKMLRRAGANETEIQNLTAQIRELREARKNIRDRLREEFKEWRNQTGEGNETEDRDRNQTGNGKKNKSNE